MQEHFFEYFKSEDHSGFLPNVSITLIDKINGKDPKRRENYWIRTLKTYAPFGLKSMVYLETVVCCSACKCVSFLNI